MANMKVVDTWGHDDLNDLYQQMYMKLNHVQCGFKTVYRYIWGVFTILWSPLHVSLHSRHVVQPMCHSGTQHISHYLSLSPSTLDAEHYFHGSNLCGGFHKWGYPWIMRLNGYEPSILGYPHLWKRSYVFWWGMLGCQIGNLSTCVSWRKGCSMEIHRWWFLSTFHFGGAPQLAKVVYHFSAWVYSD